MNSEELKDRAEVRLFPPGVPVITILIGVGLQRLWPLDLGFTIPAPGRYWAGGVLVVGSLLGLGLWSVMLFRRSDQSVSPWKGTPEIVERGPFRITRNPTPGLDVLRRQEVTEPLSLSFVEPDPNQPRRPLPVERREHRGQPRGPRPVRAPHDDGTGVRLGS